jgi:hypothetical protein
LHTKRCFPSKKPLSKGLEDRFKSRDGSSADELTLIPPTPLGVHVPGDWVAPNSPGASTSPSIVLAEGSEATTSFERLGETY